MFLREIGIIPENGAPTPKGDERASLTNLSRRAMLGGSGVFVIGLTLAGCNSYVEPDIDADAFDVGEAGPSPLTEVAGGDATPDGVEGTDSGATGNDEGEQSGEGEGADVGGGQGADGRGGAAHAEPVQRVG